MKDPVSRAEQAAQECREAARAAHEILADIKRTAREVGDQMGQVDAAIALGVDARVRAAVDATVQTVGPSLTEALDRWCEGHGRFYVQQAANELNQEIVEAAADAAYTQIRDRILSRMDAEFRANSPLFKERGYRIDLAQPGEEPPG